jgi:hypothetical protein
LEEVVGDGEE